MFFLKATIFDIYVTKKKSEPIDTVIGVFLEKMKTTFDQEEKIIRSNPTLYILI